MENTAVEVSEIGTTHKPECKKSGPLNRGAFLLKKELPRDTDVEGPLGAAARAAQPWEETLKVIWGSARRALNPWVSLGGEGAKAGCLRRDEALECLTQAVCRHSEDQSSVPCS